jgi:hypothetical protein
MRTTYDERKFTELMLYVADRLQPDRAGGATRLNKVMFFADFAHVRRTGRPITGATYQKLEHGPAVRRLRPVRDQLVAKGDAEHRDEDFLGYQQRRLIPLRPADLTAFTDGELATIDKVLSDLHGLDARQVSTPTSQRLEREAAERLGLVAS